jgi:hypothetical protein
MKDGIDAVVLTTSVTFAQSKQAYMPMQQNQAPTPVYPMQNRE